MAENTTDGPCKRELVRNRRPRTPSSSNELKIKVVFPPGVNGFSEEQKRLLTRWCAKELASQLLKEEGHEELAKRVWDKQ